MTVNDLLQKYDNCIEDNVVQMNRKLVNDLRTHRGGFTDAQNRLAIGLVGYSSGVWKALAKKKISVMALTEIYNARLIRASKSKVAVFAVKRHLLNMRRSIKMIDRKYPEGTFNEIHSLMMDIQARLDRIELDEIKREQ